MAQSAAVRSSSGPWSERFVFKILRLVHAVRKLLGYALNSSQLTLRSRAKSGESGGWESASRAIMQFDPPTSVKLSETVGLPSSSGR